MNFAQQFAHIGVALAPSGAVVTLGFALGRARRLPDAAVLAPLVADVATPCLVLFVFASVRLNPSALGRVALASVACLIAFALLSALILRATGMRVRPYLGPLSFPNTGNLGIPVAAAAFGSPGIAYATVFYAISSLANCVFGQALAAGTVNWRRVGRMPLVYAAALGGCASFWRIELPGTLLRSIDLVGSMAVPLMLLMLGAALSSLRAASTLRPFALSFLRLSMGAAVGYVVASAFWLNGTSFAVLVTQASMPVAVNSYLFAQRWDCEPTEVAAMVAVSTAASCATIPLLLVTLTH